MVGEFYDIFKAYDVRGRVPEQLDSSIVFALGRAAARVLDIKTAVIGRDARLSSPELAGALTAGLQQEGVAVTNLGLCGTEEVYFAASGGNFDAGLMITGSHNPANENGLKLVRAGAIPVSRDSGLWEIARVGRLLTDNSYAFANSPPNLSYRKDFINWLLDYSGMRTVSSPLRVLVDCGNGCAGVLLQQLLPQLPFEVILRHSEPDGRFPNGVPNPLLPERRSGTAQAVRDHRADLGVAFDGDFDRCFFYDHTGQMVETCHLIGHVAVELLRARPDAPVVHDKRVYWLTRELVTAAGGRPIASRGGHSFMKEKMREVNALYGGEMSGHHFYRDFSYCDSGMLTFLLLCARLGTLRIKLADLVAEGQRKYPCSGEINFAANRGNLEHIWQKYAGRAVCADRLDGINLEFAQWRFNLRSSNTEPLLRLNIETRADPALLREKTEELGNEITKQDV